MSTETAIETHITDVLGREVWRGSIDGTYTVDASSWKAGVYLLLAGKQAFRLVKL